MTTSRIALIMTVVGLVAWAGKAVAIAFVGDGGLAGILFFAGLLAQLSAAVCLGLVVTRGRHPGVRLLAAIAAPIASAAFAGLINLVVERVQPANPSWVWGEINLWVMAGVLLGLAVLVINGRLRSPRVRMEP